MKFARAHPAFPQFNNTPFTTLQPPANTASSASLKPETLDTRSKLKSRKDSYARRESSRFITFITCFKFPYQNHRFNASMIAPITHASGSGRRYQTSCSSLGISVSP